MCGVTREAERLPPPSELSLECILLAGLASVLFFLRFAALDLAPFIQDEPNLQLLLDHALAGRQLPLLGLGGTYQLHYGPTALWFYLPLRLFTDNASWIVAYHAAAYGLAFWTLQRALRISFGPLAAGWAVLACASSPLLFFYSRLPWDNTLLVPCTALLVYALARLERSQAPRYFLLLGLAAGLAFNTHLMAVPVLAAVLIAWPFGSLARASRGATAGKLGLTALPFLLLAGIYLAGLWSSPSAPAPQGGLWSTLQRCISVFGEYLSPAGLGYFLGRSAAPEGLSRAATIFAWLSLLACAWKARRSRPPPLVRFAFASLCGTFFLFCFLRPDPFHPHYLMALWWLPGFFPALLLSQAGPRSRMVLRSACLLLAATNLFTLLQAAGDLKENHGAATEHYGSSIRELRRATGEICDLLDESGHTMALVYLGSNAPWLFPPPLAYFAAHEPGCQGKSLAFYGTPSASAPLPGALHILLRASAPGSSSAVLELVKGSAPKD